MTESTAALRADLGGPFRARFSADPRWLAMAPGRVNLIGDHTDYAGGLALPMAIDLATVALAAPGQDASDQLRIVSAAYGETAFHANAPAERVGNWSDYLRGVHAGFLRRGARVPALDIMLGSSVPAGAGLSSSAALELCMAALLECVCDLPLSREDRAELCQRAEHDYAGVPCGILDQFAISFARAGEALVLDCRARSVQPVPIPSGVRFAVVDSGLRHDLSDGSYAARRREVERAEALLQQSLRDCSADDLPRLQDRTLRARARHVISENGHVGDFAAALSRGDFAAAGALMFASHASLAQDFAVSCREMDALVEAARDAGALGARMTGGGFGGSMVCLVEAAETERFSTRLRADAASTPGGIRWVTPGAGPRAEVLR